VNYKLV